MSVKQQLSFLRLGGHRLTKTRRAVLAAFDTARAPISAADLLESLEEVGCSVHKTTLYRELEFLVDQGLIQPVHIAASTQHYESTNQPHHHHAVCTDCGQVNQLHSLELEAKIEQMSQQLAKTGFEVSGHSFEMFGECRECQS